MRHDIHEGIMSITQVSVNGSYIPIGCHLGGILFLLPKKPFTKS